MTESRKELPTQTDVHNLVKSTTIAIRHAKIECEADTANAELNSPDNDDSLEKDLDSLTFAIKDYALTLKERRHAKKVEDRDSGISLDRSSGTLRDSLPIQESGALSSMERQRLNCYEHLSQNRRRRTTERFSE